jgi:hypothetical protein
MYAGETAGLEYGDKLTEQRNQDEMAQENINLRKEQLESADRANQMKIHAEQEEAQAQQQQGGLSKNPPNQTGEMTPQHKSMADWISGVLNGNPRTAEQGFDMVQPNSTRLNADGSIDAISKEGHPIHIGADEANSVHQMNMYGMRAGTYNPYQAGMMPYRQQQLQAQTQLTQGKVAAQPSIENLRQARLAEINANTFIKLNGKPLNELDQSHLTDDQIQQKMTVEAQAEHLAKAQAEEDSARLAFADANGGNDPSAKSKATSALNLATRIRQQSEDAYNKIVQKLDGKGGFSVGNQPTTAGVGSTTPTTPATQPQQNQNVMGPNAKASEVGATMRMQFPDGQIKLVPQDQIDQYRAMGGAVLNQ